MKKVQTMLLLISAALCLASFVAFEKATHEEVSLPGYYRQLDTSLPFNDLARKSLDPRISNAEYDAIRRQYFEDRVRQHFEPYQATAAWEDFKQRTERPDAPGRARTLGDYADTFRIVFFAFALCLITGLTVWFWKAIAVPAIGVLSQAGIYGLLQLVWHGKRGTSNVNQQPNTKIECSIWSNGSDGLGIRILGGLPVRKLHFDRAQSPITVEVGDRDVQANIDKSSFWDSNCGELINKGFRDWISEHDLKTGDHVWLEVIEAKKRFRLTLSQQMHL